MSNIEIFPVALSNEVNILNFYGAGQGASLLPEWGGIGLNATYSNQIAVNTLDNLIGNRFENSNLLVKIDVEGNEFNVLKGAKILLERENAPTWIIEHDLLKNFKIENPYYVQLFELIYDIGYKSFTLESALREINYQDVIHYAEGGKKSYKGINIVFKK